MSSSLKRRARFGYMRKAERDTALAWFYIAMAALAVFNIALVCAAGKMQNIFRPLLAATILIACTGYVTMALSHTLEAAAISRKIIYVGGCFGPLFILLLTATVCGLNVKKPVTAGLTAYSVFVMLLASTIGNSDIFYRNIRIESVNGVTVLLMDYGPAHIFVILLIALYTIISIVMVIYAVTHRSRTSYKTAGTVGLILVGGFLIYAIEKYLPAGLDILPAYYNICMYIFLTITNRMEMYDMKNSIIRSMNNLEEYGYITVDKKKNFMSSNELAKKFFPSLEKCKVDYPLQAPENDDPRAGIIEWLNDAEPDTSEASRKYEVAGRVFRFSIRNLKRKNRQYGYLLEFYDITKEERYVDMIEHYNNDLQNEVKEQTAHISSIKDMMVLGMAAMVDSRDNSTGGHIRRTSDVVMLFSKRLMQHEEEFQFTEEFLRKVAKAAPMHDLGKIAVDDRVLKKKGKYTPAEYAEMKKHPGEGAKIVRQILTGIEEPDFVNIAENVAHYHHEKWNGEGYPEGLSGTAIPVEARIMALADVFDALVSKRYYKDAYSYDTAFSIIEDSLGTHFDPRLGKVFISCRPELEELYDYYKDHGDDVFSNVESRRNFEEGLLEGSSPVEAVSKSKSIA